MVKKGESMLDTGQERSSVSPALTQAALIRLFVLTLVSLMKSFSTAILKPARRDSISWREVLYPPPTFAFGKLDPSNLMGADEHYNLEKVI